MKILAFDTSTKYLSIALADDKGIAAEFHEDVGIRHSEMLVPEISTLLSKTGWSVRDIDLLCPGLGPGSFTGLRIGVVTCKGIAAVTRCPVKGVVSFDAMLSKVPETAQRVCPLIDARKGKVYAGLYEKRENEYVRQALPALLEVDDLAGRIEKRTLCFGDGISRYSGKLKKIPNIVIDDGIDWYPRASEIALIGRDLSGKGSDDPAGLDPLYLYSRECSITNR
ncbi:MAG: tRNA (adenosine(37)-N6)-threonylcarbamoyltransferase complex dimerization subunit type 1 TsaB [Candidatus Omnitrophica bacterium]|nr:tRNA (adenosine(37)-N6)-threonylcarbamoyltransferase complex dimerization subunit type 1 TsaB [Candidatus Omnitrophota bacterium]